MWLVIKIITMKNGENYSKKSLVLPWSLPAIQKYKITKYWVNILRIWLFRKTKYLWSPDKSSKLFDSKPIFFIIQIVWKLKSWFLTFKSSSYWSRIVLGFYLWKDFTITDISRKVVTSLFVMVKQYQSSIFKRVAASWLIDEQLSFHLVCGAFRP